MLLSVAFLIITVDFAEFVKLKGLSMSTVSKIGGAFDGLKGEKKLLVADPAVVVFFFKLCAVAEIEDDVEAEMSKFLFSVSSAGAYSLKRDGCAVAL